MRNHPAISAGRPARMAGAVVAAASALALVAAGCGGGTNVPGKGKPDAAAGRSPSAAQIPTGTQLGHLLVDARLPAGWSQVTGVAHDEQDSGPLPEPVEGPQPRQYVCPAVNGYAQAATFTDWWGRSYASLVVQYPSEQGPPEVTLTLAAYDPGYAARTMALTAELAGHCESFKDTYVNGYRVTATTTAVAHLGSQNLYLVSVEHTPYGNVTGQVLLVRVGNEIAGVDTNDAGGGSVRPATVQGFAAWLTGLLQPVRAPR